jgi:hypothetical protein
MVSRRRRTSQRTLRPSDSDAIASHDLKLVVITVLDRMRLHWRDKVASGPTFIIHQFQGVQQVARTYV